jgi:Uma2 family endonuclease
MSSQPKKILSPEEYLALERASDHRSEFLNGEVFAMAGASPRHALIVSNLVRELSLGLRDRPCAVFASDLRLRVTPTGLYTYPDVMVACGDLKFADDHHDTLLNPSLVVEVLSPSTQDWDRGGKFAHYRTLDSVSDYLLVYQDRPHVELFARQGEGQWLFSELDRGDDAVKLRSLGLSLELAEIYAKVELLPP